MSDDPHDVFSRSRTRELPDNYEALVHRLARGDRPLVFLVGSPLTAPTERDGLGVPGVHGVVDIMALHVDGVARERIQQLKRASGRDLYQQAFEALLQFAGQDVANLVIREAVLRSRFDTSLDPRVLDQSTIRVCERDPSGWYITRGCKRLAQLLLLNTERISGLVLTTNFDPLIEIAIRHHGGLFAHSFLAGDGNVHSVQGPVPHIVHLHGYWHGSDTLHTPSQLRRVRPDLSRSLRELVAGCTLVVAGYGGWEDVATNAIAEALTDKRAFPDVIWTFYDSDPKRACACLSPSIRALLESGDSRITPYFGIDIHEFFDFLYQAIRPEKDYESQLFWWMARMFVEKALGNAPDDVFQKIEAVTGKSMDDHIEEQLQLSARLVRELASGISGSQERVVRVVLRTVKERSRAMQEEPDFFEDDWELLGPPSELLKEAVCEEDTQVEGDSQQTEALQSVGNPTPLESTLQLGGFLVIYYQSLNMLSQLDSFDGFDEVVQQAANTLNLHCSNAGVPRVFSPPLDAADATRQVARSTESMESLAATIRKVRGYRFEQWFRLGFVSSYHMMAADTGDAQAAADAASEVASITTRLGLPDDLVQRSLAEPMTDVFREAARVEFNAAD